MSEKEAKNNFEDLNTFLYKRIKEMIKNNHLKPDEKIKQVELAKKLGISRTPLLKVLHRLASENVIEYSPNRGFKVKQLSLKELIEIFDVREVIQGVSAKNVVEKASDEEIEELESYFSPFKEKEDDIDEKEYYKADKKFHSKLIDFSRNALLKKINKMFNIHNFSYQEGLIRPPRATIEEHLNMIEAIKNRNKRRAQSLAMTHIARSCNNISDEILENN